MELQFASLRAPNAFPKSFNVNRNLIKLDCLSPRNGPFNKNGHYRTCTQRKKKKVLHTPKCSIEDPEHPEKNPGADLGIGEDGKGNGRVGMWGNSPLCVDIALKDYIDYSKNL